MIVTYSLQGNASDRDRSFYAFANHRPIYNNQTTSKPGTITVGSSVKPTIHSGTMTVKGPARLMSAGQSRMVTQPRNMFSPTSEYSLMPPALRCEKSMAPKPTQYKTQNTTVVATRLDHLYKSQGLVSQSTKTERGSQIQSLCRVSSSSGVLNTKQLKQLNQDMANVIPEPKPIREMLRYKTRVDKSTEKSLEKDQFNDNKNADQSNSINPTAPEIESTSLVNLVVPDQILHVGELQLKRKQMRTLKKHSKSRRATRKKKDVEFVMVNDRVMSAAADATKQGVSSLYNKGLFPRQGTVSHNSTFGKIAKAFKLYSPKSQTFAGIKMPAVEPIAVDQSAEDHPDGFAQQMQLLRDMSNDEQTGCGDVRNYMNLFGEYQQYFSQDPDLKMQNGRNITGMTQTLEQSLANSRSRLAEPNELNNPLKQESQEVSDKEEMIMMPMNQTDNSLSIPAKSDQKVDKIFTPKKERPLSFNPTTRHLNVGKQIVNSEREHMLIEQRPSVYRPVSSRPTIPEASRRLSSSKSKQNITIQPEGPNKKRAQSGLVSRRQKKQEQKDIDLIELAKDLVINQIQFTRIASANSDSLLKPGILPNQNVLSLKGMQGQNIVVGSKLYLSQVPDQLISTLARHTNEPQDHLNHTRLGSGRFEIQITSNGGAKKVRHIIEVTKPAESDYMSFLPFNQGSIQQTQQSPPSQLRSSLADNAQKSIKTIDDKLQSLAECEDIGTIKAVSSHHRNSEQSELEKAKERPFKTMDPGPTKAMSFNVPTLGTPANQSKHPKSISNSDAKELLLQTNPIKTPKANLSTKKLSNLSQHFDQQVRTTMPDIIYRIPQAIFDSELLESAIVDQNQNMVQSMDEETEEAKYIVPSDSNYDSNKLAADIGGNMPLYSFHEQALKEVTNSGEVSPYENSNKYGPKYSHYDTAQFNQSQLIFGQMSPPFTNGLQQMQQLDIALNDAANQSFYNNQFGSLSNHSQRASQTERSSVEKKPHVLRLRSAINIPTQMVKVLTKTTISQASQRNSKRINAGVGIDANTELLEMDQSLPSFAFLENTGNHFNVNVVVPNNKLQSAIKHQQKNLISATPPPVKAFKYIKHHQMLKQDELVALKENQVVSLSRATIPEKTSFRKVPQQQIGVQGSRIMTLKEKQELIQLLAQHRQRTIEEAQTVGKDHVPLQNLDSYQNLLQSKQFPRDPSTLRKTFQQITNRPGSADNKPLSHQQTAAFDGRSHSQKYIISGVSTAMMNSNVLSRQENLSKSKDSKQLKNEYDSKNQTQMKKFEYGDGLLSPVVIGSRDQLSLPESKSKKSIKIDKRKHSEPHNESNVSLNSVSPSPYQRPFSQNRYEAEATSEHKLTESSHSRGRRLKDHQNMDLAEFNDSDLPRKSSKAHQNILREVLMSGQQPSLNVEDQNSTLFPNETLMIIRSFNSTQKAKPVSSQDSNSARTPILTSFNKPRPVRDKVKQSQDGVQTLLLNQSSKLSKPSVDLRPACISTNMASSYNFYDYRQSKTSESNSLNYGQPLAPQPTQQLKPNSTIRVSRGQNAQRSKEYQMQSAIDAKMSATTLIKPQGMQTNKPGVSSALIQNHNRQNYETQEGYISGKQGRRLVEFDESSLAGLHSIRVQVNNQTKSEVELRQENILRNQHKVEQSKSALFNQIGKQLQTVSDKQVINSSFLRRGIDNIYDHVTGSAIQIHSNHIFFGEPRNDRQAVFSYAPTRAGYASAANQHINFKPSMVLNRTSIDTLAKNDLICDKHRISQTNRPSEYIELQTKVQADYPSFSLGYSSTVDLNGYTRFPSRLGSTKVTGKRPTSSATPGKPPEQVIKPGAIIHDAVRRPRPMTAAQQRGMHVNSQGNYSQKLHYTGSDITQSIQNAQCNQMHKVKQSLNSTQSQENTCMNTHGSQFVFKPTKMTPKQSYNLIGHQVNRQVKQQIN